MAHGRHQKHLKGRIIVHGDPAIDEDERFAADGDHFRREIGRRRGAGANQLPQRKIQIVRRMRLVVVFGERIVRNRPRRIGRRIAHHQKQQRFDPGRAKRRILPEDTLELFGKRRAVEFRLEERRQVGEQPGFVEHRGAVLDVEVHHIGDRHSHRDTGGNNSAGACAGDVVKIVGKPIIRIAALLDQQPLHIGQDLQRQHPANAAAVEREELAGSVAREALHQMGLVFCARGHEILLCAI